MSHSGADGDSWGDCVCDVRGCENSLLSAWFCCEPKTTLKKTNIYFLKSNHQACGIAKLKGLLTTSYVPFSQGRRMVPVSQSEGSFPPGEAQWLAELSGRTEGLAVVVFFEGLL